MTDGDSVLRAITDDCAFRVLAVRSTTTVRDAAAAQRVKGSDARLFGELLTGAALVRETMAPDLRVQLILQNPNLRSRMVADAFPDGTNRGLVQGNPGEGLLLEADGTVLQVMRTLKNGQIQQGIVSVPKDGGISGALMQYMRRSEQVISVIAVGCLGPATPSPDDADNDIVAAGGYTIQMLPEVKSAPLKIMVDRLTSIDGLDRLLLSDTSDPAKLMESLLEGQAFQRLASSGLSFGCNCSETRILAAMATLPRAEIESMITAQKILEITCHYCNKEYQIVPESLRGLLSPS